MFFHVVIKTSSQKITIAIFLIMKVKKTDSANTLRPERITTQIKLRLTVVGPAVASGCSLTERIAYSLSTMKPVAVDFFYF